MKSRTLRRLARRSMRLVCWSPPNSRSKTSRGSVSLGSGWVGLFHESVAL
jgi:hypothetical protein